MNTKTSKFVEYFLVLTNGRKRTMWQDGEKEDNETLLHNYILLSNASKKVDGRIEVRVNGVIVDPMVEFA